MNYSDAVSLVESYIGDLEMFAKSCWAKKPAVYSTEDPRMIESLLTLEDIDNLLCSPSLRPPYIEIKRDGVCVREKTWTRVAGSPSLRIMDAVDVDAISREFSKGGTIVLDDLDDYIPSQRYLCQAFESVFSSPSESVAFITPANFQGLGLHYDSFDGFILQVHGTKTWEVYEPIRPLPRRQSGLRPRDAGPCVFSAALRPGDCLYVPWGFPHRASSGDSLSVHVTILSLTASWRSVMRSLVQSAIPESAYNQLPDLRKGSLSEMADQFSPFVQELVQQLGDLPLEEMLAYHINSGIRSSSSRAGFLVQDIKRESLSLGSLVRRNPGVSFSANPLPDGKLEFRASGLTLHLPAFTAKVLAEIDGAMEARVRDLDRSLRDSALLSLVGRLVDCGVLEIC